MDSTDDPELACLQGLLGCPGRIDRDPIDCTYVIALLKFCDLGSSVGCIRLATSDADLPRRKVSFKKETDKPNSQPARGVADPGTLGRPRKHRVNDNGMALRQNPDRRAARSYRKLSR